MTTHFSTTTLLGVPYAIVDYNSATRIIIQNALVRRSFGVSALAVHGIIESIRNEMLAQHIANINMIVPDGKPVQWALNILNNAALPDRVSGPDLTKHVLQAAHTTGLKVYLYGSTVNTLEKLSQLITKVYPNILLCGSHVDRFRDATHEEDLEDIKKINDSGAQIVLVGRGCPRQEVWVSQHIGKINAVMMAIGAAFDFLVGNIKRPPVWIQQIGFEWLYRLSQDPKRLFKRYAVTNILYIYYILGEFLGKRFVHPIR